MFLYFLTRKPEFAVLTMWTRAKTISGPMAGGARLATPAQAVIMIVTMIGIATGN